MSKAFLQRHRSKCKKILIFDTGPSKRNSLFSPFPYLENEEKRESKGKISLLPILKEGPPREIFSSPHFHSKIINHMCT